MTFAGPADAKALGIETVYQDLSLCPNVDVVANFFMGRELYRRVAGLGFLRETAMQAETERALADLGTHIPSVRTTVEHLSGGQRQAIELCRFVHWGGRLVLLDEPFAALGVQQTRRGLELVEQIKRKGVAIIVITHNVLHAFHVADRIVVLRHGRVAGTRAAASTSHEEIVEPDHGRPRRRCRRRAPRPERSRRLRSSAPSPGSGRTRWRAASAPGSGTRARTAPGCRPGCTPSWRARSRRSAG